MKRLLLLLSIVIASFTATAQNAKVDAHGNYVAVKNATVKNTGKNTGKTFTDTKGIVYPVYESAKGKLYYIRKSKAGNEYKVYLKVD